MNCRARKKVKKSDVVLQEISRIDQIWSDCRSEYSGIGPWLFGRFSIADCMYAPVVFRFQTYGADISTDSRAYMTEILDNQHIINWLAAARQESETLPEGEVGEDISI